MLLLDDLLLAPVGGLLWVFEQIHNAAQEERAGEAEAITTELRELYMMLETGRITEVEFDEKEQVLLDRLEAARERASQPDQEEGEEGGDGEEDDDTAAGKESR